MCAYALHTWRILFLFLSLTLSHIFLATDSSQGILQSRNSLSGAQRQTRSTDDRWSRWREDCRNNRIRSIFLGPPADCRYIAVDHFALSSPFGRASRYETVKGCCVSEHLSRELGHWGSDGRIPVDKRAEHLLVALLRHVGTYRALSNGLHPRDTRRLRNDSDNRKKTMFFAACSLTHLFILQRRLTCTIRLYAK